MYCLSCLTHFYDHFLRCQIHQSVSGRRVSSISPQLPGSSNMAVAHLRIYAAIGPFETSGNPGDIPSVMRVAAHVFFRMEKDEFFFP